MVVRHGRVTETTQSDLAALLRDILQQQTAMLRVQAESVRLQRVLVERLFGVAAPHRDPTEPGSTEPTTSTRNEAATLQAATPLVAPPIPVAPPERSEPARTEPTVTQAPAPTSAEAEADLPFAPAPADQNAARGSRYYQPGPSPAARSIGPEELELMRRLHEMRDASDLILQFGPYKGSTLAQVAMSDPEHIRQLMRGAQRPEVRAAAGRLVQALDAAAEHKPKTRSSARRGRPSR